MILLSSEKVRLHESFKDKASAHNSTLTLGGTGPNGSSQVPHLINLGWDFIHTLDKINILSGSVFSYFICMALKSDALNITNYLNYDKKMRIMHKSSLIRAARHFTKKNWKTTPLYDNSLIKETILLLFDESFINQTLGQISEKIRFWVYCSTSNKNLYISAEEYPDMKLWEVISACVSIPFIHGEFKFGDHSFRDAVFSPTFLSIKKEILKGSKNHLYINYKSTKESRNVIFIKNTMTKFPKFELLSDYFMLTANIPNRRVHKSHKKIVQSYC
jgi:hypothetical protein